MIRKYTYSYIYLVFVYDVLFHLVTYEVVDEEMHFCAASRTAAVRAICERIEARVNCKADDYNLSRILRPFFNLYNMYKYVGAAQPLTHHSWRPNFHPVSFTLKESSVVQLTADNRDVVEIRYNGRIQPAKNWRKDRYIGKN